MTMADPASGRSAQWSPRPAVVGVGWVLCAAALAWTVLGTAATGRLLTGITTVALALLAGYGTVVRPRLAADAAGVTVRGVTRHRRWDWGAVRIRVSRTRRLGRTVSLLELDGLDDHGVEQLVLLGRLDLGTEPEEVADAIREVRRTTGHTDQAG